MNSYAFDTTLRMGDRSIARPLPIQQKIADIHALSGIRNRDTSVRGVQHRTRFGPGGHYDLR
jgi:hypothetical protein